MRSGPRRTAKRAAFAAMLFATLPGAFAQSPPSLGEAFEQGKALGRSGNAAARSNINGGTAQSTVPGYTASPPEASYFGSPGLGTQASARTSACASGPAATDPSCMAVQFSQTNPTRRPDFSIGTNDPLLTRGRAITADPQAIAGNIAGTYSGCSVQTVTTADRFETAICHQYRTLETATCDKVLIVTPIQTPGCTDGQFLTRVTADPCPACIDYLAFDFSCAANSYLMHVFTIDKGTGAIYMDLGSQNVPGGLNTQIPQTPGPTRIDGFCTIGAWFYNPCQGTSYYGANTFAMPTTVSFSDSWDNQCAALEARAQ
jgi:conjugal transfer mating pair stabilization protein TraN